MLIELKKNRVSFALGMRWLIASNSEIEQIKDQSDMHYGFVLPHKMVKQSKYKLAVLTNVEHKNAYSLAGILADAFENLILIHKFSADFYWLCVIKNHHVWNEIDIGGQTAGDYIGDLDKVLEIYQLAKDHFSEEQIDISGNQFSSNITFNKLNQLNINNKNNETKEIKLLEFVDHLKRPNKYRIKLVESYKKKLRQLAGLAFVVLMLGIGAYYVYSTQNAQAQARAAQQRAAMEAQAAVQRKLILVRNLELKVINQQGSKMIDQFIGILSQLTLESQGWAINQVEFYGNIPNQLQTHLTRSPYGNLLSFKQAYADKSKQKSINDDNNTGKKLLVFSPMIIDPLDKTKQQMIDKILFNSSPDQRYEFISYIQTHQLEITVEKDHAGDYGIVDSHFTISGEGLWNLRKLQFIFNRFPSLVIESISMKITNTTNMSWTLEGVLYG
jgi:hypothetical protein